MRTPLLSLKAVLLALTFGLAVCASASAQNVTGAGASFPAPIDAKWADSYNKQTGVRINYQSVGSSAGVQQIKAKTIDFAGSDAPLSEQDLAQAGLIQFPTLIGGVVPVVNIRGIAPGQLKLSGAVLADIYLGRITRWNDPAIVRLNPGVPLPNAAIAVIRRADGSGTSFAFTDYLSKVSANWRSEVGAGTSVKWPTGAGGKGNEGVSAFVMRLPNSIGYVEYAYAKQNRMSHVSLQNADGRFVQPTTSAFQAAAAGIDWSKSFAQSLTNASGANTWPISTATFILVYKRPQNPATTAAALKFFDWAFRQGDQQAAELDYVAFPNDVKTLVRQSWAQVVGSDGKPLSW
ncbi:MAG: phosphate ABC transporter substrate-binding protein PstS [Xanthomonadaceae bacterium]|jgi:phosphate transport system substrate-binding protein|nr:phosphate ABC transporter substrate-binding protein PstS [Xanthomonadaceae bacterium]